MLKSALPAGTMSRLHLLNFLMILMLHLCPGGYLQIFVAAKSDLSFEIKEDFSCGPKGNFLCHKNATTTADGLLKPLPDPKGRNETFEYYVGTVGSGLYRSPLQVLDRKAGMTASFSATFSFQIEKDINHESSTPGDGMAFVMFPYQSYIGEPGECLGAYLPDESELQGMGMMAVEFDTYVNPEFDYVEQPGDITFGMDHVGINVNERKSRKARILEQFTLTGTERVHVWLDHNSSVPIFEVRVNNKSSRPKEAFLSYALDLPAIFGTQEQVWVGFSASNGGWHGFATVYDFSLTSSLEKAHLASSPSSSGPLPSPTSPSPSSSPSSPPSTGTSPASTPPSSAEELSFKIKEEFKCGSSSTTNMVCNGSATTTKDGLLKLLPYPRDRNESREFYQFSIGTAVFGAPVQLLELSAGRAASFSAQFSFQIEVDASQADVKPGDGMAFVLFPSPSYMGQDGGSLGALAHQPGRTTNLAENETVIAVEFDTYMNSWELRDTGNHVGIDVDYAVSRAARALTELNLITEKRVYAWIDHDCTVPRLEVRVSTQSTRPKEAFLSYALDLFAVLGEQEQAWVGFSAANGERHAFYTVYDLSFTSSLESSPARSAPTPSLTPEMSPGSGLQPEMGPSPDVETTSTSPPPPESVTPSGTISSPSPGSNSPKLHAGVFARVTVCTWTALMVAGLLV